MQYNMDMTLRDLMSDDRCVAILDRFLPGVSEKLRANPMGRTLSLRMVAQFTQGMISEESLQSIDAELQRLNDGSLTPREQEKVARYRALLEADRKAQATEKPENGGQKAIYPGKPWLDTAGKRIQAHGGAVLFEDGWYYWYGENKEHTDGENGIWSWGIRCYRSKDLMNWQDLGMIIEPDVENPDANLFPDKHVDRPHIIRSRATGKFVCWIKLSGVSSCFAVLAADAVTGPYELIRENYRPFGYQVGDFDLHVDEKSGKAYLYETGNHDGVYGFELSDDCCEAVRQISLQYEGLEPPLTREGVAVFEAQGKKYMFTSGMTGYLPNPSDCAVTPSWEQSFRSLGDPHVADESHASFNSQISKVFPVQGKYLYIAMADRWVPDTLLDATLVDKIGRVIGSSGHPEKYAVTSEERQEVMAIRAMDDTRQNTSLSDYVWLPVCFEGEKATIRWMDSWNLEDC